MGYVKIWVPDMVHKLLPACNNNSEIAIGLKHIVAADGVHFTQSGYEKMALVMHQQLTTQRCKNNLAAGPIISGSGSVPCGPSGGNSSKTFYWRGFVSPTGSCRPKQNNAAFRASHPGGGGKWKGHPVNVGPQIIQNRGGGQNRGGRQSRGGGQYRSGGQNRGNAVPGVSGGRGRGASRPFPYYRRN